MLGLLAGEAAEGALAGLAGEGRDAGDGLLAGLGGEARDAGLGWDACETLDAACALLIPKMPGDM